MKPLHSSLRRLRRCPCCQTRYSKKNDAGKNSGKSAARRKAKNELRREL